MTSAHDLLAEISDLGRDPITGGYRRFSFTAEDRALRDWFTSHAGSRGLRVEVDDAANLWATRGEGPWVATGSHLDSVPNGGAFDGPLGIASAFAALDRIEPETDVAIVAFAEEEGARFGLACLGSRLVTGAIDAESAMNLVDAEGTAVGQAIAHAGIELGDPGRGAKLLSGVKAFVELHIEQGRGLAEVDAPLGLGESIWPHGRWRLDFAGQVDHAGTARMEDRHDPMPAFAHTALAMTECARSLAARATFGRIEVEPNATNAVAARVSAWLDARAPDEESFADLLSALPTADGVSISRESWTPGTVFDPRLRAVLAELLAQPPLLTTAAGHDAGILASKVPTAMIFVRNPSGISHSPAERAEPRDCQSGVEALATVLASL